MNNQAFIWRSGPNKNQTSEIGFDRYSFIGLKKYAGYVSKIGNIRTDMQPVRWVKEAQVSDLGIPSVISIKAYEKIGKVG